MQLTNLKQLRQLSNLTQSQLADIVGVKQSIISRYETGHIKNPKESRLTRLELALSDTGLTDDELILFERILSFKKADVDI